MNRGPRRPRRASAATRPADRDHERELLAPVLERHRPHRAGSPHRCTSLPRTARHSRGRTARAESVLADHDAMPCVRVHGDERVGRPTAASARVGMMPHSSGCCGSRALVPTASGMIGSSWHRDERARRRVPRRRVRDRDAVRVIARRRPRRAVRATTGSRRRRRRARRARRSACRTSHRLTVDSRCTLRLLIGPDLADRCLQRLARRRVHDGSVLGERVQPLAYRNGHVRPGDHPEGHDVASVRVLPVGSRRSSATAVSAFEIPIAL